MPSFISLALSLCLTLQPSMAQPQVKRPLLSKKETLKLVQSKTSGSISKKDLVLGLQKKYGHKTEDQKLIEQISAYNFKEIKWTLSFENGDILVRVTEPEIYNLRISELERMLTGAMVNGKHLNFQSSLSDIQQALGEKSKASNSIFNLIFVEKAEALLWFILPVAAIVAVVGTLTAMAVANDLENSERLFNSAHKSCDQDVAMKRNIPGESTSAQLGELAKIGYDDKSFQRFKTVDECSQSEDPLYPRRICRLMIPLKDCLAKLSTSTNTAPIVPPQPVGTPVN